MGSRLSEAECRGPLRVSVSGALLSRLTPPLSRGVDEVLARGGGAQQPQARAQPDEVRGEGVGVGAEFTLGPYTMLKFASDQESLVNATW